MSIPPNLIPAPTAVDLVPKGILYSTILREAKGFIINTNSRSSINNGPFRNSAIVYLERLYVASQLLKNHQPLPVPSPFPPL